MFRILDRYILREVTLSWLAVTGVLLVILLSNQLARVLERAAENRFPRDVVLALIGYTSLENLTILIPVGLLLAIVLAFGRLYHESEMAAVHACGVGVARLYVPVLSLTVVLTGLLVWLALVMSPHAAERVQELRGEALRDAQFGNLEPGRFRTVGGTGVVFYAAAVDRDGTLRDVFVKRNEGPRIEIAVARLARHHVGENGLLHTLVLEQGRRYEGIPGSRAFRVTEFAEHGIPVRLPEVVGGASDVELKPTSALFASSDLEDRAELQWRLSIPLMAVVLTLLAVPLARLRPRQGRYARIGLAILLYFLYSNLLAAAKVWVARGVVPEALGLWWVHAALVALALLALFRDDIWRWLRPRAAAVK
ncbi:MAG TPA: LPS export ABC transporter permease LptF [Steroidobacteraceae bacterium]|nr:LPS export ABC transporter permease LptF [Steroidobacteraceae bacterium]